MEGVTKLLAPLAVLVVWVLVLDIAPGLIRAFVDTIRDLL